MIIEVVIQVIDDVNLLLDYLGKHPVFDCEQSRDFGDVPIVYLGLDAHPKRHASYNLKHDAS